MRSSSIFIAILLLTAVFAAGCGSSAPATLGELKFGRNQTADPSATEFNTGETIYAVTSVANAPSGMHKLKWRILFDEVAGKAKGEQFGANTSEFEGSKQVWQAFGSPLPGRYTVEAVLTDSADKQVAVRTGTINIMGEAVPESPDSMQRPSRK